MRRARSPEPVRKGWPIELASPEPFSSMRLARFRSRCSQSSCVFCRIRNLSVSASTQTLRSDARLIAATSHDVAAMVREQKFRSDLFFRLMFFRSQLPPLRDGPRTFPLIMARHLSADAHVVWTNRLASIPAETIAHSPRTSGPVTFVSCRTSSNAPLSYRRFSTQGAGGRIETCSAGAKRDEKSGAFGSRADRGMLEDVERSKFECFRANPLDRVRSQRRCGSSGNEPLDAAAPHA